MGNQLAPDELLDEFEKHQDRWNQEPTALVSVSDRIVDTLKRALEMHYEDLESPSKIQVVFIEVPEPESKSTPTIHHARQLAEDCGLPEPKCFSYEFVFEWAIPEEYVLHTVSLQTLMDHQQQSFIMDNVLPFPPPKTQELRRRIAKQLQSFSSHYDPWEIGEVLADFASTFGARAPHEWIAHQLFNDCVSSKLDDEIDDMIHLEFSLDHSTTVDYVWFQNLQEGITTALDEWFERIVFSADHDILEESEDTVEHGIAWKDTVEHGIAWEDTVEHGIAWEDTVEHDIAWEDTVENDIAWEMDMFFDGSCYEWEQFSESCDEALDELSSEHRESRAAIEREAVRIGF